MASQGRLGDKSHVPICNHGCPACPHVCIGPGVLGSPNVKVNGRPALRMDDAGIHGGCCMRNDWAASGGSATVFINGKPAHRMGDEGEHCGGLGKLNEGSSNVMTGGPEIRREKLPMRPDQHSIKQKIHDMSSKVTRDLAPREVTNPNLSGQSGLDTFSGGSDLVGGPPSSELSSGPLPGGPGPRLLESPTNLVKKIGDLSKHVIKKIE